MATSRPIHCIFYSHVWSIFQLEALGLIKADGDEMLLELALESKFSTVFSRPEKRRGLIRLLRPGINLHMLAYKPESLNVPIILASNPQTTPDLLIEALSLISAVESPIDKITALVHINDAPQFTAAYPLMCDFSIVWDVVDFPNAALSALSESLVMEQCLSKDKWKGFYLCNHPSRQLPDNKARESVLRNVLNDFPVLHPA
jgi:hypothetical protein